MCNCFIIYYKVYYEIEDLYYLFIKYFNINIQLYIKYSMYLVILN